MGSPSHSFPHPSLSPPPTQQPDQLPSICDASLDLVENPHALENPNSEEYVQDQENSEHFDQDSLNPGMNSFTDTPVSVELHLTSQSHLFRLPSFSKRKKGKPNVKKQQAIERKYQTLKENLNPIPFLPSKILYFSKHEKLLRRLGLWDFVSIEFDRTFRTDLIAQLVASYDSKLRCSYVNGVRILVNRADLGRALKLPVKKEKVTGVGEGVEVDSDLLSEESIAFIEDFLSNWVLLHEDTWMMPLEVLNWRKVIKDGHPEKVDWAGLLWFMVEKELNQGEQLVDCYYASHLQYLMKYQREEVVLAGGPDEVKLDGEVKEVVVGVANESCLLIDCTTEVQKEMADVGVESERVDLDGEENEGEVGEGSLEIDPITDVTKEDVDVPTRFPIELTLGEDVGAEEKIVEEEKDVHHAGMMGLEEGNDHVGDDNPGKWQLDTENIVGEHTLQRCNLRVGKDLFNYEGIKEEVEDIEEGGEDAEDTFDIMQNHDSFAEDGLTGNFLQAMQENKLAFSSHEQFREQPDIGFVASRNDMQHANSAGPSFYGSGGKRPVEHMPENTLNGNNKRLRIDGPWNNESPNFVMCMDEMQRLITRATMMYEAKEQSLEQSNTNQQILLNEVQKRDSVIEHLHKSKCEEMQKKDEEIYRLERELYVTGNLLDGYREALKGTQKAFAEYKQCFPVPEESIYKDAGPGGIMLTTEEIERRRLKQQEDHRTNCLMLEQKAKEAEEGYAREFAAFLENVLKLDSRLLRLGNEILELKNLSSNLKGTGNEHSISRKTGMPIDCEGTEDEQPDSKETSMLEQPASNETGMPGDYKGTKNEQPVSKETSMLEQPAFSDIDMADNCKGTENEDPVSTEASMLEQPTCVIDIPDNFEGTENEQPLFRETSTPDNHQGMETELN